MWCSPSSWKPDCSDCYCSSGSSHPAELLGSGLVLGGCLQRVLGCDLSSGLSAVDTTTCSGGGSRGVKWTLWGSLVVVLFSTLVFSNVGYAASEVDMWTDSGPLVKQDVTGNGIRCCLLLPWSRAVLSRCNSLSWLASSQEVALSREHQLWYYRGDINLPWNHLHKYSGLSGDGGGHGALMSLCFLSSATR